MGEPASPPKPFSENLIDIVMIFADRWHMTPFDVLGKDIEDFIILSNYLMSMETDEPQQKQIKTTKKDTRIRVNDKTATGGWF